MKKISIVLPVYNGEKYISGAIQSILDQTYDNFELIVVNDHSTDRTADIISGYASEDKRIRIITNSVNKKLPGSLNVGFDAAAGEYLTWTSDDNLYRPEALAEMASILDSDPDTDLVYADFSRIDPDGNFVCKVRLYDPPEMRFQNVVGACFLYRRSLAEKAGRYDPETFLAEDYEFFLRCYENGSFCHLSKDLYYYREHEGTLTATRQKDIASQKYVVLNMHFDQLLSVCETKEDRYRLFTKIISLARTKQEKTECRKRFCDMDPSFIPLDRFNQLKEKARLALHPLSVIYQKIHNNN